ncbi:MAG: YHS domain protein, partial [Leptospiraceae bacterium]|nr:YHS domain protein [Leptospiraceae bacterium]
MKFFKVIFFSFLLITPLFSGELNTTFFKNLAIDGYDSVAYFTEGKAVEGNSKYEYKWKGGVWRFSKK